MLLQRNRIFLLFHVVWISLKMGLRSAYISESPRGIYQNATAVADNGLCSQIGADVMQQGGNAVESVIAMAICTGVASPQSSGLGGGHFLTFYQRSNRSCTVFDARETAPRKMRRDLLSEGGSESGWLSIAVPGELHGLWTAYNKFGGNLPWERLWTPSIRLCREGVPISADVAQQIKDNFRAINNSHFSEYKNEKTGQWKLAGDTIKCEKLAETMEKLSKCKDPVKFFYDSSMTDEIVEEIQKNGGILTREDMKNYRTKFGADERPPVYSRFSPDLTFCAPPPPSSGSLVTSILGILKSFDDLANLDKNSLDDVVRLYHRFIEASKFAYGVRSQLGDMDFNAEALNISRMVNSPEYIRKIHKILPEKNLADSSFYTKFGGAFLPDHGTAHMSAIDKDGNAAALTSSINLHFGSRRKSSVTGILFNDHADDFSFGLKSNYFKIAPSTANRARPGKRPQSSMSPLVAFDPQTGHARLAIGGAGGVKIISATAQVLMRLLFLNETIKEAIDAPRMFNQLIPYNTTYEANFPKDIAQVLHDKFGQSIGTPETSFRSFVCGINRLNEETLEANSDYRKGGGYPDGF